MKELSIIICVFNEQDNIHPLVRQIEAALDGFDYEVIYVDDGSTDQTRERVRELRHPRIKLVELRRNYGQSYALAAGIEHAQGTHLVTMDGDLQNDPLDIPMMLKIAREGGFDLVAGIRANRQDGMFLRKIPSKIANRVIQRTTGVRIKDYGCTLKVFTSPIAKDLGLYGELHRFIPVLASLEGARITQTDVRHHARVHGSSKYGINRTFKVVSDLLLMLFFQKYLQKPMHLFGTWGMAIFGAGALINLYLLALKVAGEDIWGKPLMILGLMLLIAGIQFITIGLVLEVQTRTYYESQQKKPYTVRKVSEWPQPRQAD